MTTGKEKEAAQFLSFGKWHLFHFFYLRSAYCACGYRDISLLYPFYKRTWLCRSAVPALSLDCAIERPLSAPSLYAAAVG